MPLLSGRLLRVRGETRPRARFSFPGSRKTVVCAGPDTPDPSTSARGERSERQLTTLVPTGPVNNLVMWRLRGRVR